MVTDERDEKIKFLAANRQESLTVILENVHDPHNLFAILRTCDTVGIREIYAVYTIENKETLEDLANGKRSSSGSKKWVDVHFYNSIPECFKDVKEKYNRILGTHMGKSSKSLYNLDLTQPTALLFGNEHRGISEEALELMDGNFLIPQVGMTQSLNISVACAVSVFEAKRQRLVAGMYPEAFDDENPFHKEMYNHYVKVSKPRYLEELD